MIPVLLKRRGAKKVFATDMFDFREKVALVKQATHTDFGYAGKLRLERTVEQFAGIGEVNFDLVVLSGVLYHVFDPMHALGVARSLVRPGGIVIVETAAVVEDGFAMYYNDQGRHYFDWTSFWFITPPCLDSILRYYRLAPLDCVFLHPDTSGSKPICRIAVACRAMRDCIPLEGDRWMRDATKTFDYSGVIDWEHSENSTVTDNVPYDLTNVQLPRHPGIHTCDLGATVKTGQPLEVTLEQLHLGLSDLV
jgi:SAM-dependent methyltransferase